MVSFVSKRATGGAGQDLWAVVNRRRYSYRGWGNAGGSLFGGRSSP
jgi:hypothetical protein